MTTENTFYSLQYQISLIHKAGGLIEFVEKKIDLERPEQFPMTEIDFAIQKIISTLYTIDAVYIILKDSVASHNKKKHVLYLQQIRDLVKKYNRLKNKLNALQNELRKKLHWQDLFISTIFGHAEQEEAKKPLTLS